MKNKRNIRHISLIGLIILVAAVLRLWQLGNVPPSPDWDEAALGYNAYSIMQTCLAQTWLSKESQDRHTTLVCNRQMTAGALA